MKFLLEDFIAGGKIWRRGKKKGFTQKKGGNMNCFYLVLTLLLPSEMNWEMGEFLNLFVCFFKNRHFLSLLVTY